MKISSSLGLGATTLSPMSNAKILKSVGFDGIDFQFCGQYSTTNIFREGVTEGIIAKCEEIKKIGLEISQTHLHYLSSEHYGPGRYPEFEKEYLAVIHGAPEADADRLTDLLIRDKARRMTMVVSQEGKGVQPAALTYRVLNQNHGMSRVRIRLETGRTHQIRVQFASRQLPLVGERKYSTLEDACEIALWSCYLSFTHPVTGKKMELYHEPPEIYPWTVC